MKKPHTKHTSQLKKRMKMRTRFACRFFWLIFTYYAVVYLFLRLLEYFGVPLQSLKAPAMATIIISLLCIILSFFASCSSMRLFFLPLAKLSQGAKEIAKGNFKVQISYQGNIEELQNTIDNFNFMAQELNSVEILRNNFVANISHEFKTPLSSISGYVTLLQDEELTREERDLYIQRTMLNIEKLNTLTENILRLSKLENQNHLDAPETYRLDEQIREAVVFLEPKWSKKEIALDIDLQEISYTGQQALLFQVWVNFIGNAIKFSEQQGEISIRLYQDHDLIKGIISDDGIGMSEETMRHIFDKFYQGDSSRKSQGSGLGLALCKEILDKCGGAVRVSSTPGKGSVFMVTLWQKPEAPTF